MILSVCRNPEEVELMKSCTYAYRYPTTLVLKRASGKIKRGRTGKHPQADPAALKLLANRQKCVILILNLQGWLWSALWKGKRDLWRLEQETVTEDY